jgi:nitroreductase
MTASESDPQPVLSLLEGLATTRAIRRYRDQPLPTEDLAKILWYAGRAPSGSNRQAFRFLTLLDGPNAQRARQRLGESFRHGWAVKREQDNYRPSRFADSMQEYVDSFEQHPVVILVCLDRYRAPTFHEGASVYPACQNLLLAARALGYGGALTMWHLEIESELREILSIPEHVALSACITLGVPAGRHGPLRRKKLSQVTFEDSWGAVPEWADINDPI